MKTNYVKEAVVLVAGLLLGVLLAHVLAPKPAAAPLGGNVVNTANQYVAGTCLGSLPVCENWAGGKIEAKSNQASWRNTTGGVVYVDLAELATDGTASSSFKLYVGTSTAATIASDFTAPFASLINGVILATSTIATTTTNYDVAAQTPHSIRVADGVYVNFQLQEKDSNACGVAGTCETATSSNRGFNLQWRLQYHN